MFNIQYLIVNCQALRPSEPEAPTGYIGSKFDVPVGTVSAESSRGFVLKGLK